MNQPMGFEHSDKHLMCKLNDVIYGLKPALMAWFKILNKELRSFGFISSMCDPSLFTLITHNYSIIMLVYVDDIIVHTTHLHIFMSSFSNQIISLHLNIWSIYNIL